MKAIVITEPGGPDVLRLDDVPEPQLQPGHVIIEVAAAGVNRADLGQRAGSYPPPPGAPAWPGLEISGTIVAVESAASRYRVGDEVCALLAGGGYAERVVVNEAHVLPVPAGVPLVDAAALPEALATVWSNVFMLAGLRSGETLLVHGGSSGIGTAAIQLAAARGARVAVTAGSAAKLDACAALGADILIDYTTEDFEQRLRDETGGADVILDLVGGAYLHRNLSSLRMNGRLVIIANQSRENAPLPIHLLMRKRASIHGTTLRARPDAEKAQIMSSLEKNVWPMIEAGLVEPVVSEIVPLADAARAHQILEESAHIGKVLLVP
ncbi:NAD(P)H-quinone oxidoreductase [Compostimonas suwonensis]|uniref:Putative PIG3 family NAD(P)H quinone oxidoreductase n=1 Tax=Compostimonas suwonensis TaxID=1048394 RepID=A0A2M9BZ93_9MICO|nr:NAD(P)H-quinone oxidoreductase [Compostimonas suwonensis]PJJ63402.1 putative PIG3 family NAD(P)H quinone oxidoreductase [Compostimonas suwonensis]